MNDLTFTLLFLLLVFWFSFDFNKLKHLFERRYKPINDIELVAFRYRKHAYLKSIEWKKLRHSVLVRDNYTCQICNSSANLHVHHMSYRNLFHEPLDDLITLCNTCHTNIHETFGYPQTVEQYQQWSHMLVTKPNKITFKDLHVSTNSN